MNTINQTNNNGASPLGSTNSGGSSSGTPTGDKALYYAMMALSAELGTLSMAETSTAKLADALYKNMVPNSTQVLENMQNELDAESWVVQNYDAYANYFNHGGPEPALGPGMTQDDLALMKKFFEDHPTIKSASSALQLQAQAVSQQNTIVGQSKVIPEGLEDNTKSLANAQTQDALMIAPFTELVRSLYYRAI